MNIEIISILNDLELLNRVLISAVCGVLIGYERMNHNKAAGVKTHMIVCMSASLMMITSKYAFFDVNDFDASRVAAQVVSGVSFLGAGIIFKKNNNIQGLTTAAGIWGTSSVGLILGGGMYFMGIVSTILFVFLKTFVQKIEKFQSVFSKEYIIHLRKDSLEYYLNRFKDFEIVDLSMKDNSGDRVILEVNLIFQNKNQKLEWENLILMNNDTLQMSVK